MYVSYQFFELNARRMHASFVYTYNQKTHDQIICLLSAWKVWFNILFTEAKPCRSCIYAAHPILGKLDLRAHHIASVAIKVKLAAKENQVEMHAARTRVVLRYRPWSATTQRHRHRRLPAWSSIDRTATDRRVKRLKNKNSFIVPYFFRNIAQFVTRYSIANYRSPSRKIPCSKLLQSFSFLLFRFWNILVFVVRARFLTIENLDPNNRYNPLKDRL